MIHHVVFFRLARYSPEAVAELAERLRAMRGAIPELAGIEVGVDVDRSERAWDVALVTRFRSAEDLAAYRAHPVHQGVLAHVRESCSQTAVVDWESD